MTAPVRRILPPIWLLLAICASYALNRWFPIAVWLREPWTYAGIPLMLLGGLISIPSALSFRSAGTGVVPFTHRRCW
jgi:hypothetical protein